MSGLAISMSRKLYHRTYPFVDLKRLNEHNLNANDALEHFASSMMPFLNVILYTFFQQSLDHRIGHWEASLFSSFNAFTLQQRPHLKLCQKYADAIEQNAWSRQVTYIVSGGALNSSHSLGKWAALAAAAAAAQSAIGGGSMIYWLDFDFWDFIHWRWRRMATVPGTILAGRR